MFEWLTEVFSNANTTTLEGTEQINGAQVNAFRDQLAHEPLLRFFVGSGGGRGNQASTVNLLRRFVDPLTLHNLTFNYSQVIDVYYDGGQLTLDNLYEMLPEMGGAPHGRIRNATVNLIPFVEGGEPPADAVNFGFSGAIDSNTTDLATALHVHYFLQLQPYFYTRSNWLWFGDRRPKINMDTTPELNNPSFNRRVFYLPPESYNNPDWGTYTDNKAQILEYLTSAAILGEVRLVVSYIVMPQGKSVINSSSEAVATILSASLLQWQEHGNYRMAAPVVILNLNDFCTPLNDSGLQMVDGLLAGVPTRQESILIARDDQKVKRAFEARSNYFKSLDATNRWSFLNYPPVADVRREVEQMITAKNKVLFVQIGGIPQPLFYYALSKTNMFSVFEGNNSLAAAMNMGNPFLNPPRKGSPLSSALYPDINRGFFSATPPINALVEAANQLNFDLDAWPATVSQNPCMLMGNFLQTLTDQMVTRTDPIPKYFLDIKEYYAQSANDKLNVGIAYMLNLYQVDHPVQFMALSPFTAALLAADENPLNALYKELAKKVTIGQTLDLVPGVIAGGNINTILLNLLKGFSATLWLLVDTFTKKGTDTNVEEITLTGSTGVFKDLQVINAIAIIFTAPNKQLRTTVKFGTLDPSKKEDYWSIPGVPWIQMWNPYLKITVSDGQLPVNAEMGGTYKPINADLKVLIPVAKNQWLTTVSFSTDYPGIATIFQMAAGVNLVQMMPPPINTLVDLGLKQVDLYYDYDKQTVPALGFIIANNSLTPLPLIGPVSLGDIEVQVAVVEPQGKRITKANASAKFTIGTGTDAGVVAVNVLYPNWQFQGGLESGVIKFADLLAMFLPGVSLDLPQLPTITEFSFNYLKASDLMSISMKLNILWDFMFFGKNLFSILDVGFSVSREKALNTGNVTGNVALFKGSASEVDLNIGAYYLGESNWQFIAKQTGGVFSINDLMKYYLGDAWVAPDIFPKVNGLSLTLDWGKTGSTSFEFTAKTAERWYPLGKEQFPDIWATGSMMMGYNGKAPGNAIVLFGEKPVGSYGKLAATVNLWNINVQMAYNFDPTVQNLCITWLFVTGCIGTDKVGDTIATFKLNGKSVGEMVEMFVSWATGAEYGLVAPWNVLNSFTLNAFEVVYNFTKKKVSFKINLGPIDFGIFKINGISLAYNPDDKQSPVEITIDGSFVWQSGDSLSWDPTKPECTPAPPGGGNKYLDLRLLALGQHVTVTGLTEQRQVQDVIAMLRDLKIPSPPEIPVGGPGQPVFAAENSWFVAMDFGVLKVEKETKSRLLPVPTADAEAAAEYFIQLSLVFNDPILYALRIALAGPMAKIFKGLDFQIMYSQVSDTVGRYAAQIALPDIMRKFQIGIATITLPVFAIEVYTNGDFQVDIGFPWKEDFSRSFTIEVIVAPGIPILGSAGFYFGKLSSATTNKVPKATNGWFNPVLVFGFGAQLGLGKSIELGILSAGFSLTVFGIIEGVIARFLPYKEPTKEGLPMSLQDGYYFSLTGTVGVLGRLYGSINFAIIKADVNIEIKLFLRITFAAYQDIPITAQASVRVSVKVTINLGIFKISISLSFSATVSATFVLKNPLGGTPPWITAGQSVSTLALQSRRLRQAQHIYTTGLNAIAPDIFINPQWNSLLPGTMLNLEGYLAPVLTVAGDLATQPVAQEICYVANFFLKTPTPVQQHSETNAANKANEVNVAHAALANTRQRQLGKLQNTGAATDTFTDLAIRMLQWVIAAGLKKSLTPDQVNQEVVSHRYLSSAMDYLANSSAIPIPATDINTFLNGQAAILFTIPSSQGEASTVFFPAPPGATLQVPDYGSWQGFDYTFGGYNSSSAEYLQGLNDYFKQLKIQVQEEEAKQGTPVNAVTETGPSIADYVFSDYFAVVASQGLQALINGLENFKWVLNPSFSVADMVNWVNTTGQLEGEDVFTAGQLFTANQEHLLKANRPFTISGMNWTSPGAFSFTAIAAEPQFKGAFNATALATFNASNARILAANMTVTYNSHAYLTDSGDSLTSIANFFKIDIPTLLSSTTILTDSTVIQPLAMIAIPDFSYTTASENTLSTIAGIFAISQDLLATSNTDKKDIFDPTHDPNLNFPGLAQFQLGALLEEAERTLGLQNLGAMASRYYLHGLRLPTQGLTAKARGLFVSGSAPNYVYPDQLGLYALTGQAFPLPDIQDPAKPDAPLFTFTINRGSDTWYSLGATGSASATFTLSDKDDYQRYRNVWNYAKTTILDTATTRITPLPAAASQPSRFPLAQEISWQSTVPVILPRQTVTPDNPRLRLWTFADSLVNTPHENGVLPLLKPVLAQADESTGTTHDVDITNYGFGTLIHFKIKRTQPVAGSPTTGQLYEIIEAATKDITLLERLLNQLPDNNDVFQQLVLLYPPQSSASDVQGWQMDDPARSLMGICQVNLSTETRPPLQLQKQAVASNNSLINLINPPIQFLRLLWEASITRQGGFYLDYFTGIGSRVKGLPDFIFNDRGEADIAVLALFKTDSSQGIYTTNYMNIAATNQPLDLDTAALIAQVIPVSTRSDQTPVSYTPAASLLEIAALYYMDPGLLVTLNATTPLNQNALITIAGGSYEVPPVGVTPGAVLADIAAYFNTTVTAIKQANPFQTDWSDPLPLYTGLKLPVVDLYIGKAYFAGTIFTTFSDLARYYNAPIAQLTAANLAKGNLFSTVLNLAIGPNGLAPVLQAGVAGINLSRTAPAELPPLPTDSDWGKIYLLQLFNLLGYRVAGNAAFAQSFFGLPAGPTYEDNTTTTDKIQAARTLAAGEKWLYAQTVPYPNRYAHKTANDSSSALPPVTDSPYWGVGGLLQLELQWLDIYGNSIISPFNVPSPAYSTSLNFQPQITGYTDRLVGVGQWPAVANAYRFLPDKENKPTLEMMLAFDKTVYEAASADDQKIKLQSALKAYQQIWYQLNDPNGLTIALTTTVTPGVTSLINDTQVKALMTWVASIYNYLLSLLQQHAAAFTPEFSFTVPIDPARLNSSQIFKVSATLEFCRQASLVNGELATSAGVTRVASALAPWTGSLTTNEKNTAAYHHFMAAAGRQSSTLSASSDTTEQREMGAFAAAFKSAFATLGGSALEITSSSDRDTFSTSASDNVWAVQLGNQNTQNDISFTIQNENNPTLYAPRPISNTLQSRAQTAVIPYETGKVLLPSDPPRFKSFTDIDLDQWMRFTLSQVDELLSPKFVAPAQVLRQKTGLDLMQNVLDAKKNLAIGLKSAMIPVFAQETVAEKEKASIQETFFQTMLGTLSKFYAVKAGIQFQAQVNAAIQKQSESTQPPRLFGDIVMLPTQSGEATPLGNISLSSPKLDLKFAQQTEEPSYLSFLLSSSAIIAKKVALNLQYNGQYIEHQIGHLHGIEGYLPSSWLSFANNTQATTWPLTRSLGEFLVPIVLREFPPTPTLVVQDNIDFGPVSDADTLANLTVWNYSFIYSQHIHALQNAVHGTLEFNITFQSSPTALTAVQRDLFDNLAQFTQEYPRVHSDLNTYLATMAIETSDPTQIKNASTALESAANIIQWVADSVKSNLNIQSRAMFLKAASLPPYLFTLTEDQVEKTNPDHTTVWALQVTVKLQQDPPLRVGSPWVQIQPEIYTCEPDSSNGDRTYTFFYKDKKTGAYLEAATAMTIAERQFILPDMGMLERQDVQTTIFLARNEELIDGKPTAAPFIYTTPPISFIAPLLPSKQVDTPINLALIDAVSPDVPVTRSLTSQLTVFFCALFANAGTDQVTLEMTTYYEYSFTPDLPKVSLPLSLMPPMLITLPGGTGSGETLDSMIAQQVAGINAWFKANTPDETNGTLYFNLTIMSTLTENPMPLLKLTAAYVNLEDLDPKPGK